MPPSAPNLFEALFDFHPREYHTPKENFLTEAFAYLLRTDEAVRNCWLSVLVAKNVEDATCDITTRPTEKDSDSETSIYPDLLIEGQFSDGVPFAVYCEHKWNSPCNLGQLRKYRKASEKKGKHARLAFVGANHKQKREAGTCFPDNSCKCFLWEDVFYALDSLPNKSTLLTEFLVFMKTHGLSPGQPLTVEGMRAFLQASEFIKSLMNMANKLQTDYSWDCIPDRFHASTFVHDAYGRVGIRFETKAWKPALTVGFLYDVTDHKVAFANRDRGIDLFLRIEAMPKDTRNIQSALNVLQAKRSELRKTASSVLLKAERGNGNAYSVLIVQECLADVIEDAKTQAGQLVAIHDRLSTWLRVLFRDGTLEKAFARCGLNSGMK
jgi:hypothetical protein